MALIPLAFQGWVYDDVTKRVIATFTDAPSSTDADPVNFQPSMTLEVVLQPLSETKGAVARPTPPGPPAKP